ncbi:ATP-dependent DNA helicase [Trinickia acidisoli]|uniref:ATP-dependent DNA helicase n=1 Tax=Trinickia acidisoli TaxID=2767482 RepID=UPI001A8E7B37|nr:ATP-dependent DNA helicase [Trinickia acidisoli]
MSYVVAVRTLCEFTAKQGDLDLRFTPSPTALEGIEGHAAVTARRKAERQGGYEAELTLAGSYGELSVRGRADGYDPALNRLDEIKTYRGQLDAMPDNHRALHWAQALVYGHLLCQAQGLAELNVALVYFDIGTRKETILTQKHDAAALHRFFDQQCERFLGWAMRESDHRGARNAALERLPFPHGAFRSGQRELAVAVYRAARDGRALMAQAPTGIGKTLATLFPALKACAQGHVERIFFLTAKTPGRALALDAIDSLHRCDSALPLRTLELVARDKACEHPDKSCHGESCPLARGFYDRLAAARETALASRRLDRETVRRAALAHEVCPYYLAQELARWCDIVVGDYNYYYDSSALLYALTRINQWNVAVLVDEAHNLLERGRKMYTASIEQAAFKAAAKSTPAVLKKPLQRLQREWNALNRAQASAYQTYAEVPARVLSAAQNLIGAVTDHLADAPLSLGDTLLRVFFDAMHFVSLSEQFGEHSVFDVRLSGKSTADQDRSLSTLCVRNVVPAHFLAARHAAARATVVFSGTLAPQQFYRDMLGLPDGTAAIDVEGPFRPQQLKIHVAAHVSTRWRDRERSLIPIVDLMARQYADRPGNYLGFLSSFDYLQRIAERLREHYPEVPIWTQAPGMDEAARDAFLARFRMAERETGRIGGIGLAVLGGAFSEGVDLVGEQLIGAFVATLGLPQVNDVNEEMRRKMDAKFGRGYDYVYLYPGLQKVVQAAGRVIRTETDAGVLHLIDDRYRHAEVRRLLPAWWALP